VTETRRLITILAADIAGYSRLIGADEGGTLRKLKRMRKAAGRLAQPPTRLV
jgi:class 3 adenylate cyclase